MASNPAAMVTRHSGTAAPYQRSREGRSVSKRLTSSSPIGAARSKMRTKAIHRRSCLKLHTPRQARMMRASASNGVARVGPTDSSKAASGTVRTVGRGIRRTLRLRAVAGMPEATWPTGRERRVRCDPVAENPAACVRSIPPPAEHKEIRADREEHRRVVRQKRDRRSQHVDDQANSAVGKRGVLLPHRPAASLPPLANAGSRHASRSVRMAEELGDAQHGQGRPKSEEGIPSRILRVPDLERRDREEERSSDPESMVANGPTECVHERDREHTEHHRQKTHCRLAVPEHQPAVEERVVERRVPGIDERAPTPELRERLPCEAGLSASSSVRGCAPIL